MSSRTAAAALGAVAIVGFPLGSALADPPAAPSAKTPTELRAPLAGYKTLDEQLREERRAERHKRLVASHLKLWERARDRKPTKTYRERVRTWSNSRLSEANKGLRADIRRAKRAAERRAARERQAAAESVQAAAAARTSTPRNSKPARSSQSGSGSQTPASGGGGSSATPGHLQAIAACESGGDASAIGGGGAYRGKYQFDRQTWASVGGSGDPASASESEQDRRAAALYSQRGSSPWPTCGR
jgi:hypothetical protein